MANEIKGGDKVSAVEGGREAIARESHAKARVSYTLAEQYAYDFLMELKKIRDEKLFRELGHKTFAAYCDGEWDVSRDMLYEKIQLAERYGEGVSAIADRIGHKKSLLLSRMEVETRDDVIENGIRDPIKCTTAFTVVSGHQRLRIAKELGFTEVPVEIIDKDEWEAEYLLIAENVERRGQAELNPIKKARIAGFLKEYWEVQRGGDQIAKGHNVRSVSGIAEAIGETPKTTQRLLKLNDLIPQFQRMVSSGKLGTTSAEQLAYLTNEVQTALYDAMGEEIGEQTVAQVKQLRTDSDGKTAEEIQRQLDGETAEILRGCSNQIDTELKETSIRIGGILSKAQDQLSKNGYGCFGAWLEYKGIPRRSAYEMMDTYKTFVRIPHNQKAVFQALPISLSKAVSAQSLESPLYNRLKRIFHLTLTPSNQQNGLHAPGNWRKNVTLLLKTN